MNKIQLLVVENNDEIIANYQETIDRLLRGDINFFMNVAKNLEEAIGIINSEDIDIAIIDLNLSQDKGSGNAEGNAAIKEIKVKHRLPIYVISAEPEILDDKLKDIVTLYKKGTTSTMDIFKEMHQVFKSEIIQYFLKDGYLEKMISDFYWNHLSRTMKSWQEVESEYPTEIEKILSRHTVSSLNEQLYVNGNVGSFDRYHPGEMYIIPPIKRHYHTGDIVEKDGEKFIIINPACDIVNRGKLYNYILVTLIELNTFFCFDEYVKEDKDYLCFYESLNKKGKEIYLKYKSNAQGASCHFLPSFDVISDDYIINFQKINIVQIGEEEIVKKEGETKEEFNIRYLKNREEYIEEYEQIASISSPFLKDIIARFSAYYARQGQPNLL